MDSMLQPAWADAAGLWIGFIFTLLIFSALLGDHLLARLAQYVLVGVVLGYAVIVTWQSILSSPLIITLRSDPTSAPWKWLPVVLAAIMAIAGLERIFAQGRTIGPTGAWRSVLRTIGAIPALALVAVGMAVALVGGVQGTLAPQFMHTARTGLLWGAPLTDFVGGLLTLLLTTATLIFFVLDADRHLSNQPTWVQRLMRGWVWIGQRALWLAAGALFARLFASRLTLFLAELATWVPIFQSSEIGRVFESWWRMVAGA